MEARNTYEWAQDKLDTLIGPEQREQRACERRLRQMQARREKQAKRAAALVVELTEDNVTADAIRALGRQHD